MALNYEHNRARIGPARSHGVIIRQHGALWVGFGQALLIVLVAVITGCGYHLIMDQTLGRCSDFLSIGALVALLFSLPTVAQQLECGTGSLAEDRSTARTVFLWNVAFISLLLISLLENAIAGRGGAWVIVYYVTGLAALLAVSVHASRHHGAEWSREPAAGRRVLRVVLGQASNLDSSRVMPPDTPCCIVTTVTIPGQDRGGVAVQRDAVRHAVSLARRLEIADVLIHCDGSTETSLAGVVDAFSDLPVSIFIAADRGGLNFGDSSVCKFGPVTALSFGSRPYTPVRRVLKKTFDVLVAGSALVALSPLFIAIGILIKRDSPGPVFFCQRRGGFNQRTFQIWKFRTMTTLDDGTEIKQATVGDPRVTNVGRVLRRYNLDELPQLINVLIGDMSLVGPRPHALAHDALFATKIEKYARRVKVLPGITGWAQVNGFRGLVKTEEAIRQRVACDLYYVDNQTLIFDFYIILLTIFSARAYRNAH